MLKKLLSLFTALCVGIGFLLLLPAQALAASSFTYSSVEAWSDAPYVEVNDNQPEFEAEEYTFSSFETYSELDDLGRCGEAYACVGTDLMPTEPRGSISSVIPTGWVNVKYDIVSGGYLYNRCHLIGFQLTGENANRRNLITGTRYLNVEGMLPFEDAVADYVKTTGNHVLYRVTPIFEGDELVARGVLMEALSMEDGGAGVCFCVFCYNVQPGITIHYDTGTSTLTVTTPTGRVYTVVVPALYIVNTNTKKFHLPDCPSAVSMSEKNRVEMTATVSELAAKGYAPCSRCHPELQESAVDYLYGDIDADGHITPVDARLALRRSVDLEAFSELQMILANVDGDESVTSADARAILRASVGLEVF